MQSDAASRGMKLSGEAFDVAFAINIKALVSGKQKNNVIGRDENSIFVVW